MLVSVSATLGMMCLRRVCVTYLEVGGGGGRLRGERVWFVVRVNFFRLWAECVVSVCLCNNYIPFWCYIDVQILGRFDITLLYVKHKNPLRIFYFYACVFGSCVSKGCLPVLLCVIIRFSVATWCVLYVSVCATSVGMQVCGRPARVVCFGGALCVW